MNDSMQTQILSQEQWTIELLARETHTDIGKVQQLFLAEFARLSATARIQSFVALLTTHCVREKLDARNATVAADAQSGKLA